MTLGRGDACWFRFWGVRGSTPTPRRNLRMGQHVVRVSCAAAAVAIFRWRNGGFERSGTTGAGSEGHAFAIACVWFAFPLGHSRGFRSFLWTALRTHPSTATLRRARPERNHIWNGCWRAMSSQYFPVGVNEMRRGGNSSRLTKAESGLTTTFRGKRSG